MDGEPYSWRDGESVVFDETYVHEAYNKTQQNRIILFCDVERPLVALGRGLQPLVRPGGDVGRQLANDGGDQTGAINKLTHAHWVFEQKRKAFKAWNRNAYKAVKYGLIVLVVVAFIAL